MRILYVVQRYGPQVLGGSETAARLFAERLVARGHSVEVLTSCARDYVDWAPAEPAGTSEIAGVRVHRLPVRRTRDVRAFSELDEWMVYGPRPVPWFLQRRWALRMGPELDGQAAWIRDHASRFDVAVFMTYMYATTTDGLLAAARLVPTVLQPTAHDEPSLRAGVIDPVFRAAGAMAFFTEEERDLVLDRFGSISPNRVVGMGMELEGPPPAPRTAEDRSILDHLGLVDGRYLVYAGRFDVMKGARELREFAVAAHERDPSTPPLVFLGTEDERIAAPGVICAGYLPESDRRTVVEHSLATVVPSRFESFSIALCESWLASRPALVHADCAVTVGQARRSGGAIAYRGFAEYEAAVDLIRADDDLATRLGRNGYDYVAARYRWPVVLDLLEEVIGEAIHVHQGGART